MASKKKFKAGIDYVECAVCGLRRMSKNIDNHFDVYAEGPKQGIPIHSLNKKPRFYELRKPKDPKSKAIYIKSISSYFVVPEEESDEKLEELPTISCNNNVNNNREEDDDAAIEYEANTKTAARKAKISPTPSIISCFAKTSSQLEEENLSLNDDGYLIYKINESLNTIKKLKKNLQITDFVECEGNGYQSKLELIDEMNNFLIYNKNYLSKTKKILQNHLYQCYTLMDVLLKYFFFGARIISTPECGTNNGLVYCCYCSKELQDDHFSCQESDDEFDDDDNVIMQMEKKLGSITLF